MINILLLLAQIVSADPRFQVSWKQVGVVNGWNVAVMDKDTLNIRSMRTSSTTNMPLSTNMFPASGIWDIRINAYTLNQTSIWSNPLTINWQSTVISAPKNLRIVR